MGEKYKELTFQKAVEVVDKKLAGDNRELNRLSEIGVNHISRKMTNANKYRL